MFQIGTGSVVQKCQLERRNLDPNFLAATTSIGCMGVTVSQAKQFALRI